MDAETGVARERDRRGARSGAARRARGRTSRPCTDAGGSPPRRRRRPRARRRGPRRARAAFTTAPLAPPRARRRRSARRRASRRRRRVERTELGPKRELAAVRLRLGGVRERQRVGVDDAGPRRERAPASARTHGSRRADLGARRASASPGAPLRSACRRERLEPRDLVGAVATTSFPSRGAGGRAARSVRRAARAPPRSSTRLRASPRG